MAPIRWFLPLLMPLLAACAPALNWRDVREDSVPLLVQFPCKPQRVVQETMGLLQCEAEGQRFMLSWRTWADPAAARDALAATPAALAGRMGARPQAVAGATLPSGASAWPGGGRYLLVGGARPAALQTWAQGRTVVQALVLGDAPVAAQFFDSMRQPA